MRSTFPWAFILLTSVGACQLPSSQPQAAMCGVRLITYDLADTTVLLRFDPPVGFARAAVQANSFAGYLRHLPLKTFGANVHLYNSRLKNRQDVHAAVVDMTVGDKDLQQCADAVMRLRAEYLFAADRKQEIAFNFTSGFKAPFSRWMTGARIRVQGNACSWVAGSDAGSTHDDLLKYLDRVFTYAGTASLSKELKDCSSSPVQPGDVFIQGGHPGHAVIVVDVANDGTGEQVFLLAQSYMPAQEIHVLKNPKDPNLSPWFKLNDGDELVTPEWTFQWDQRKRWP
ncbi:MAG: DUF4846 domain-containing protein [Flavobacteriales bacterium]|nr:DUF4846 domain-containing protein [Flavobacteriales bacterium]